MEQFLQAGCQPKEHKVVSTDHNQSPALILTSPTVTILTEKLTFDGQWSLLQGISNSSSGKPK